MGHVLRTYMLTSQNQQSNQLLDTNTHSKGTSGDVGAIYLASLSHELCDKSIGRHATIIASTKSETSKNVFTESTSFTTKLNKKIMWNTSFVVIISQTAENHAHLAILLVANGCWDCRKQQEMAIQCSLQVCPSVKFGSKTFQHTLPATHHLWHILPFTRYLERIRFLAYWNFTLVFEPFDLVLFVWWNQAGVRTSFPRSCDKALVLITENHINNGIHMEGFILDLLRYIPGWAQ